MTSTSTPTVVTAHRRPAVREGTGARALRQHAPGFSSTLQHLVLALAAFVPLLLVHPGVVTDDTKTYLYLDPGRFLRQVAYMWDPNVAMGTVTHETIGYLFPMGPFFLLCSVLHIPIWVAQRLWLGGILFLAGAGILFLCRTLRMRGPGTLVAAMAFMLSPYFLQYAGRISVILLPWAGLPWMVALTALALRRGGWRYPALFALVVALVSSINASSVLYVGLAPVLWLVYAIAVEHEARWRDAFAVAVKIAVLTLLVSLWWIAGLQIEAAYGVNVLKYTETVPATSQTSTASEVLRGLGYWYFYGGDRNGPWTFSSVVYTQWVWVLVLSFLLPVLAFLSAVLTRWHYRAFFIALIVLGVVLSVAAHPYNHPTTTGGWLKDFFTGTTAGLAMRSTDRATPLVVLGTAMLLGAGASALWRRVSWAGVLTSILLAGLIIANNPAIFNGDTIANSMTQPARLPSYLRQAAAYLNTVNPGTRVLGIPGDDFAVYSWGDTVDTPEPAILKRPYAIQEQQIMGSMPTADMLYALDEPILAGTERWSSLAPMARLVSAGNILLQNDTAYWHYGIPQPQSLWSELQRIPPGLSNPRAFGKPRKNVSPFPTLNEQDLASPPNPTPPPPVVTYHVDNPRPIARAESNQGALIVAGDNSGLEHLASTGMLDTTSPIYFSGMLDTKTKQFHQLLSKGASLVVTDTNRKRAMRWDALTANTGFTETPPEHLAKTHPHDSPLNLFPGAPSSSKTTAYYVGAVNVTASTYGNPVSYLPEDRAYMAVDGNPDTAWETGAFMPSPAGQWWQLSLQHPVTAGQVRLVQPLKGILKRWITKATLTFDGGHPVTVDLGHGSRTSTGQVVTFPSRTFHTLRITIDQTTNDAAPVQTAPPVGFSAVEIPGVSVQEAIKMPTDLLGKAGTASLRNRLTLIMDRERVSPYPVRTDPETTISRQFSLPTSRTFTLSGSASISALIPDNAIDQAVGRPGSGGSGVVAYSSGRLPGDLRAGAAAAIDGDPKTAWQPGFGASHQAGTSLHYDLPRPITFDHMDLQVLADGRHSVPTQITVSTENASRTLELPAVSDSTVPGAVASIPLSFPALTGSHIKVRFDRVRLEWTSNYYSPAPIALPLGIAGLGIPGLHAPPPPAQLPGECQSNLLSIDGQPISVRIVGSTSAALHNKEMTLQPCGADANGITLGPGKHIVQTATGHQAGWNVDQLVLDSAPGGGPMPLATSSPSTDASATTLSAPQPGPSPRVHVLGQNKTSMRLSVSSAAHPFELVLGQSVNAGWKAVATPGPGARVGAHAVDLGPSQLVDGFANGWPVSKAQLAALGGQRFAVTLTWTPQTREWIALALSAASLVLCLLLAFLPRSMRERWRRLWRRLRSRRFSGPSSARSSGPSSWRFSARSDRHGRHVRPFGVLPVRRRNEPTVDTSAGRTHRRQDPPRGSEPRIELEPSPGSSGAPEREPELEPALAAPWEPGGHRPPLWASMLIAAGTGTVGALISYPLAGVAAALCTAAVLVWRPARAIVTAAAVSLVIAAGTVVVVGQVQHHLLESSNWPSAYEDAGVLAWTAVVFLGVDAAVEVARRVAGRRARSTGSQPSG